MTNIGTRSYGCIPAAERAGWNEFDQQMFDYGCECEACTGRRLAAIGMQAGADAIEDFKRTVEFSISKPVKQFKQDVSSCDNGDTIAGVRTTGYVQVIPPTAEQLQCPSPDDPDHPEARTKPLPPEPVLDEQNQRRVDAMEGIAQRSLENELKYLRTRNANLEERHRQQCVKIEALQQTDGCALVSKQLGESIDRYRTMRTLYQVENDKVEALEAGNEQLRNDVEAQRLHREVLEQVRQIDNQIHQVNAESLDAARALAHDWQKQYNQQCQVTEDVKNELSTTQWQLQGAEQTLDLYGFVKVTLNSGAYYWTKPEQTKPKKKWWRR